MSRSNDILVQYFRQISVHVIMVYLFLVDIYRVRHLQSVMIHTWPV
jgi:hypothetical protein